MPKHAVSSFMLSFKILNFHDALHFLKPLVARTWELLLVGFTTVFPCSKMPDVNPDADGANLALPEEPDPPASLPKLNESTSACTAASKSSSPPPAAAAAPPPLPFWLILHSLRE